MFIVVYVGLANLFSMFVIFVLADFQTFQGLRFQSWDFKNLTALFKN